MKKFGNILWGIILILLGLIIGGNALGITNIDIFFDGWWTLFIIIPSLIGLFKENDKTSNIIGLIIGFALLLGCQNIIDFNLIWKLFLPTILVIIGLSIIFKGMLNKKVNKEIKKENKGSYCAAFSAQEIKIEENFKGTDLTAIFGGIEFDLTNAKIEKDVVINANAIFGGIDIFVPSNVIVKTNSTSIFGGVENKSTTKEKTHTIYINGTAIFGGIEIK